MTLTRVSPTEARDLVDDEGYVLLDVRAIPEFEASRIPQARNVPFLHKTDEGMVPNPDFEKVVQALVTDRAKGVVTHCGMGGRSLRAAQALVALGYESVADMRGGFSSEKDDAGEVINAGWCDSGLPVEQGPGSAQAYELVTKGLGLEVALPGAAPAAETASVPEGAEMNRFASDKRKVKCVKYGRELPGLKRRPYPGALGVRLYDEVSALAWNEWVEHSKMIINEYRIVSTDPKALQMLYEQCERFFYGDGGDRPAEFVPVE